jgi:hypothetical protein
VSTAALVFWIIAFVLIVFAVVFVLLGQSSERGYWLQRDPSGNSRTEATSVTTVARRAGHYAAGEYRAPLRIMGIGVLLAELAIGFAVIALIVTLAG